MCGAGALAREARVGRTFLSAAFARVARALLPAKPCVGRTLLLAAAQPFPAILIPLHSRTVVLLSAYLELNSDFLGVQFKNWVELTITNQGVPGFRVLVTIRRAVKYLKRALPKKSL